MTTQFIDLSAAADFMGPGAVEINRYQTEITDIVRRRGVFGQRVKQVPATGHPSRFFEQTDIAALSAANAFVDPRNLAPVAASPSRVERSVPLKALVSQINYSQFVALVILTAAFARRMAFNLQLSRINQTLSP